MLITANGDVQIMPATQPEAPLLRKDFTLGKKVASARAYVYGLGFYELRLSGGKVGDRVMAPAATPFEDRNLYQTYDVTAQVHAGDNMIGLWLAEGYGPTYSEHGWRWLGPRQAIVKLDVRYRRHDAERRQRPSWTGRTDPYSAQIYDGESYDARLDAERVGPPRVRRARLAAGSSGLHPEPAARRGHGSADPGGGHLAAGTDRGAGARVYVFDLGQNIAGWARLHVKGERGTAVRSTSPRRSMMTGRPDTYTNRAAEATDTYVLAGTGQTETYEPRFTYHGFRYVEVRQALPEPPTMHTLDGRVVHADVDDRASFTPRTAS